MANEFNSNETVFDFQLDEFYLDLQEDGRNISILSSEEIAQRPFPGLRPFKTSEFQLFRGRGGQAEELIKRLKRNRFLAVIGSSGTGKSSLVRAGLIPELFGGSLREAGSKWNIAVCRPGKNPIANLAVALSSVKGESKNKELLHENFETIEPLLSSSIYGLLEANEILNEGKEKTDQTNLLIIVDQFEEIFRYDRKDLGRENIENHFVDLLLKAASNAASPVYVIITMRSEFLGDCVKYRGLPEAINEGQYLVPGLNRTQLKDVIEGPIKAAEKSINAGLVELLINELDEAKAKENLDQLPILQHALMRTYQEATRQGSTEITYEHYERIGGMQKALANHAREKFVALGDGNEGDNRLTKKQQIAKVIFQALTDASTDLKGGRRPTELKNIYAIATAIGATKNEVDEVIDKFRDNETSFIMPPINTELHDDLIMDISHESLMRNWDLLRDWIDEEVRYGKFYQRLNERREEDGQFIQGTLLSELLNWRENYPHNAAWATRYHNLPKGQNTAAAHEDLYNKNLLFLKRSEEAALAAREAEKLRFAEEAKLQREEDLRRQKEKSRRRMMWLLTTALVVALSLTVWAFSESSNAKKESRRARDSYQKAEALNSALRIQTGAAEAAKDSAKKDRDYALQLYAKLNDQKEILEQTNKALAAQTEEAERQRKISEKARAELALKSEELERHLAEGQLHKEDFYTSKSSSPEEKEAVISYLFTKPLSEVKIDSAKYLRKGLLQEVNTAAKARDLLLQDPVEGLRLASEVWNRDRNEPVMQLMLPVIFRKNIFHTARVDLANLDFLSAPPSTYTTTYDGIQFGMANQNQILVGRFENGVPKPESLIEAKYPVQKGFTNGFAEESETSINAVSISATGGVRALVNDSLLLQWKGKENYQLTRLSIPEGLLGAEFSTDGTVLATVTDDTVAKLWSFKPNATDQPSVDTIKGLSGLRGFKQTTFSPVSQNLLLVYENGYALYKPSTKNLQRKIERNRTGIVANFSSDGRYVLTTTSAANNTVYVYDTSGNYAAAIRLFYSSNDENFSTARITDLGLSADLKKLLVNQAGNLFLYQRDNGEKLFAPGASLIGQKNTTYYNLRSKKLFSFQGEVSKGKFLDTSTVIALTTDGMAYIWKIRPSFTSLDEAFKSVRSITDSTYLERKDAGTLTFKDVISGAQKSLLHQAAAYYFDLVYDDYPEKDGMTKRIDTAMRLYKKIAAMDSGFVQLGALSKLAELNEKLYDAEQSRPMPDTLKLIEALGEATKTREKLLELQPENEQIKNALSLNYWNLSWLLNFKKRYTVAIQCAKRGVALNPINNGAYTNLALAYLLKGDFTEAEKVYQEYKDSSYADGTGTKFRESFLKDLEDMETANLITRENEPLYKEMQRIKNDILGTKQANPKMKK